MQTRHSCISSPKYEEIFRSFLRGKKIKRAVEIGTYQGTSTAVLSYYADRVLTVDIYRCYEAQKLWLNAGCLDKMDYYRIESDEDKALLLKQQDFDFAFIDGNHREGVNLDFKLTSKCGRVLFHDYFHDSWKLPDTMVASGSKPSPWINKLVDSLPKEEVTIREPFAYWEKK